MQLYDTLGSFSQLGSDLQSLSSNGRPTGFGPGQTNWDVVTRSSFSGPTVTADSAEGMVDMVVHQGDLHVVWVQPYWNGSQRVMRGPFASRWDGSSWVTLGAEIDPSLQQVVWQNNPVPTGAVGTHGVPSRPKILSDGTDLYVVYTVREIAHGAIPPPNGSYVPGQACGCYVGTCDLTDYTIWYPRKVYIRKWNSGTGLWDLFGVVGPLTNNDLNVGNSSIATPYVRLHAYASASEPGTVYVTFSERGPMAAIRSYTLSPVCLFGIQLGVATQPAQYEGVRTAQFNAGTGSAGVIKDVYTYTIPAGSSQTIDNYPQCSPNVVIANESGTPFFFVNDLTVSPNVLRMTNWNTLVDAQTMPQGTYLDIAFPPYVPGFESATDTYFLGAQENAIVQMLDDGTTMIIPFEYPSYGTTYWIPGPSAIFWGPKFSAEMSTFGNLWGTDQNQVRQFHHNCPAWVNWGAGYDDPDLIPAGEMVIGQIGNTLYVAAGFNSRTNLAQDFSIRVYQATIHRNSASCGSAPVELLITERIALE